MKKHPVIFKSLSQLHKAMGQPTPTHPLISILNYGEALFNPADFEHGIILNFYKVSFKTSFTGKLKYGQGYYDFEAGGMSFIAPGQLLRMQDEEANYDGMTLHFHPDFLRPYSLNNTIKHFGFFSYSAAEALYLSDKEKATILSIYKFIQDELNERIDKFSQDVIISQIPDAILDDPSVGKTFRDHKSIRNYFDSYFIAYKTKTKMVHLIIHDSNHAHLEVEFTGDFPGGKIGGTFDFTFKDGKIVFVKADLIH